MNQKVLDFLKSNLRKKCNIIEIGCHIGTDTLVFLKEFDVDRYIGFEPDRRNLNSMLSNTELKKILDNNRYTIYPIAISNFNGNSTIYESYSDLNHTASSSLLEPKKHLEIFPHISFERSKYTTEVKTLDSFCFNFNPDIIWIDTQGSELDVFKGGKQTLERTKYIIFEVYDGVEMYRDQPTLKELMNELGPNWNLLFNDGEGNWLAENTNV